MATKIDVEHLYPEPVSILSERDLKTDMLMLHKTGCRDLRGGDTYDLPAGSTGRDAVKKVFDNGIIADHIHDYMDNDGFNEVDARRRALIELTHEFRMAPCVKTKPYSYPLKAWEAWRDCHDTYGGRLPVIVYHLQDLELGGRNVCAPAIIDAMTGHVAPDDLAGWSVATFKKVAKLNTVDYQGYLDLAEQEAEEQYPGLTKSHFAPSDDTLVTAGQRMTVDDMQNERAVWIACDHGTCNSLHYFAISAMTALPAR